MSIEKDLMTIRNMDTSVNCSIIDLNNINANKYKIKSLDYSSDLVQTSNDNNWENTLLGLIDKENEIKEQLDDLFELYNETREKLKSLDGIHRLVLVEYYFNNKSWNQVARSLNYDRSSIFRFKNEALKLLKEKFD